MATISFRDLSKMFGDFAAVDSFSLDVADGEFVVLVGPSGCGKTTSLRMLAGLTPPSAGEIWLGERDITDVDAKDRNVAMVFQNYALYPHMSVFDNVSFALKLQRRNREDIERAVRTLRVWTLIEGHRGRKGDPDPVLRAIEAIAAFADAHRDDLLELDVNPLLVLPDRAVAVDALIKTR